jgi:hypothetical protein
MSATNRGSKRAKDDFYSTPAWCTRRLLKAVSLPETARVLEPCAGNGHIIRAAQRPGWDWLAVEKRIEEAAALEATGALTLIGDAFGVLRGFGKVDLLVTNPPFSLAREFITHFAPKADRSFWLLRLSFLGSIDRRDWLAELRPNLWVLPNRPCFGRNKHGKAGTDSAEYAWFELPGDGRWELLDLTPREEIRADLVARGLYAAGRQRPGGSSTTSSK